MPHDQRPRTPGAGPEPDPDSQADSAGDDLEALAGALPTLAAADTPSDSDEEHDLGALATVGGQRPAAQAADGDARLSLAGANTAASTSEEARAPVASSVATAAAGGSSSPRTAPDPGAPSAPDKASRARPAWLLPLLLGLGIGAGVAGAVFIAASDRSPQASAAAAQTTAALPPPAPVAHDARPANAPLGSTVNAPENVQAPAAQAAPAAEMPSAASAAPVPPPSSASAVQSPVGAAAVATPRKSAPSADREGEPEQADEPAPANTEAPMLAVQPAAEDPLGLDKPAAPDANAKTSSTVDALLDEALSPAARSNELARRQQAALEQEQPPVTPSREQITQAMTVLLPAIRGCAMGQSGLATAAIVVRADGRVAGVEITGAPFAGTPSGRCMEGVIRRARFTPFRQPVLRIKFPLAIQ